MSTGLLFDCDEFVANWFFDTMQYPRYKFDRALGVIDHDGHLVGAVLFQHWNGNNVEVSYYGKKTMTVGVIRMIARFTLNTFNPSRLTATTSKRNRQLIKALQKIGFRLEGTQRCYYGSKDTIRNIGVRFVAFRPTIEAVAKLEKFDADDPAPAQRHTQRLPKNRAAGVGVQRAAAAELHGAGGAELGLAETRQQPATVVPIGRA